MDFESLSLIQLSLPLLFVFGAIHFGVCFVQRRKLRKALHAATLLPIAVAAGYILWALISPRRGAGFVDNGAFAAALVGVPSLFALGGSLLGWLLGRWTEKRRNLIAGDTQTTLRETKDQ